MKQVLFTLLGLGPPGVLLFPEKPIFELNQFLSMMKLIFNILLHIIFVIPFCIILIFYDFLFNVLLKVLNYLLVRAPFSFWSLIVTLR